MKKKETLTWFCDGQDVTPERVKLVTELTTDEKSDVVTVGLQPVSSVIGWILQSENRFRSTIAAILSATNFTVTVIKLWHCNDNNLHAIIIDQTKVAY